jgi:hypothetical protein
MKDFIKFGLFLQVLTVFVFACTYIAFRSANESMPISTLFISMAVVFGAQLLSHFMGPLLEKWME